jgi:hypothetical protein
MTDMQTSLPLLIVRPSILNPVMHFSTQHLTGEMKCPRLYLCLAHSIPPPSMLMQYMHQPIIKWYDPLHQSWSHLLFTVALVHRRQVLLKLHRHTRSLASKPPTCPSQLQPVHRAKPHLDLLHLDHMTQCHVSRATSSSIITCASFATSPSHFHLHGICCSHTCTSGLITYVSHIKHN